MRAEDLASRPDLEVIFEESEYRAKVERAFILRLETFDWNCPQHIVARYTREEIAAVVAPLENRLDELERENSDLRERLREAGIEKAIDPS